METHLTLEQSGRLLASKNVRGAETKNTRELLTYRDPFESVPEHPHSGEPVTEGLIRIPALMADLASYPCRRNRPDRPDGALRAGTVTSCDSTP